MNYLRIPWPLRQSLGDFIYFPFGRSRRKGEVIAYVPGFVIVRYSRKREETANNST